MRRAPVFLALCVVSAIAQQAPKPAVSPEALGSERMGIYRSFLDRYDNGSGSTLNIAQSTVAFEPREFDKSCLKEFKADDLAVRVLHNFAPDAFAERKVRLVDPAKHKRQDPDDALLRGETVDQALADGFAAGLFTFSEVVFDSSHTHAAFSYAFVCGRLCGHGATIVYDLQDGKWKQSKVGCSSWVS
jgi:hypothetical protein